MKQNKQRSRPWNLHPGEILGEDFLKPLDMSSYHLAKRLRVPVPLIHDIVLEKRGITADTAVRLARFFGTSPEFWMNAQRAVDLYDASQRLKDDVGRIKPLRVA